MFDAMLIGLEDYTTDQRGDVGSWIRMSCVTGLATFSKTLFSNAARIINFREYLPPAKYHDAVGGILKQGVERLDSVREQAGHDFLQLLHLPLPYTVSSEDWKIQGDVLMRDIFLK